MNEIARKRLKDWQAPSNIARWNILLKYFCKTESKIEFPNLNEYLHYQHSIFNGFSVRIEFCTYKSTSLKYLIAKGRAESLFTIKSYQESNKSYHENEGTKYKVTK